MPKFLTVVYTIHNEKEFRKERDAINEKFMASEGKPWAITAMSVDHEINRLHWIEEALNAEDSQAVDAAISCGDIGNVKSLDDLRS